MDDAKDKGIDKTRGKTAEIVEDALMEEDEPIPEYPINPRRIAEIMNKMVFKNIVPKEDSHFEVWVVVGGKLVKMNAEEFKKHQKRIKG